jgi:heme-degrading monooxygenase HmoA
VVARHWRGWTSAADADRYVEYLNETGVRELCGTAGNRSVQVWRRLNGGRAEFVVVSLWESREAIRAFAGEDIEVARFYPDDERYLVDREETCTHYDVVAQA